MTANTITNLFLYDLDRQQRAGAARMAELTALCGIQMREPEPIIAEDSTYCERCYEPIDQSGHRGPRKQFCDACAHEKQLARLRVACKRWRAARRIARSN